MAEPRLRVAAARIAPVWLIEPVEGQEGLFVAEVGHEQVRRARHSFGPSGHYSRPEVDRSRQRIARFRDDS